MIIKSLEEFFYNWALYHRFFFPFKSELFGYDIFKNVSLKNARFSSLSENARFENPIFSKIYKNALFELPQHPFKIFYQDYSEKSRLSMVIFLIIIFSKNASSILARFGIF